MFVYLRSPALFLAQAEQTGYAEAGGAGWMDPSTRRRSQDAGRVQTDHCLVIRRLVLLTKRLAPRSAYLGLEVPSA